VASSRVSSGARAALVTDVVKGSPADAAGRSPAMLWSRSIVGRQFVEGRFPALRPQKNGHLLRVRGAGARVS
jgi:hypothetical protein